jgi:hypothetical protein
LPFREWSSHWRGKIPSITNLLEGRRFPRGNEEYYTDLVTSTTFHAVARYQPRPYPGCLLNVIAATRRLSSSTHDTRLTWNELALKGGKTVSIPAEDSGRLFMPVHVQELAHHLAAYFDQESPADFKQSDLATSEDADGIDPARP